MGKKRRENESKFSSAIQQEFLRLWQRERKRQYYVESNTMVKKDIRIDKMDESGLISLIEVEVGRLKGRYKTRFNTTKRGPGSPKSQENKTLAKTISQPAAQLMTHDMMTRSRRAHSVTDREHT